MVTLADIDFLISDRGRLLLNELADDDLSDAKTLPLLTRLRKTYGAEQASSALTQARLRQKAIDKFGEDAKRMLFTHSALQQASDPLIRCYRAGQMATGTVIDAGCGIGADSLTFAQHEHNVVGIDIDPVRVAIARYNVEVLGLTSRARFMVADLHDGLPMQGDTVFFDPARRDANGKRIHNVERYLPPLRLMNDWADSSVIVKLSPGVDLEQVLRYGGGVEFISVNGDLKEAVLWRDVDWSGNRATLITLDGVVHHLKRETMPNIDISAPRGWLVEPDPAVIRAGLVEDVTQDCNGTMLDPTIAYFTADVYPESIWVRAWRVLDWMPFHLKRLRAYLREHDVGRVTVKKRGSPLTPETLIPKLKLKGTQERTLVLTRYESQPIVLICDVLPVNN